MMALLLGVVLVFGALGAAAVAGGVVVPGSKRVRQRLLATAPSRPDHTVRSVITQPEEAGGLRGLVPASARTKMRRHLELAGHPGGWTLQRMIMLKLVLVALGLLVLLLAVVQARGLMLVLVGLVLVVGGYLAPDVLLGGRAAERQNRIQRSLPDTLDAVLISIEAGLSLESALARTGRSGGGPLADELVRLTQDIGLGMPRRDAYLALAARTDVDELRKFVTAVVQAEEFGVSVAQIVRTQAAEMRVRRRLRAEAQAHKTAVKILFPLMSCVLPVLFIVVLAPSILTALSRF